MPDTDNPYEKYEHTEENESFPEPDPYFRTDSGSYGRDYSADENREEPYDAGDAVEETGPSQPREPSPIHEIPRAEEKSTPKRSPVQPPVQQPRQSGGKRNWWKYFAIVTGLLLIIFSSFALIIYSFDGDFYYSSGEKVAVIYIQGEMITGSIPSGYDYVTSEEVVESIRDAVEDESVRAIVLRINSGGGSAVAGEEIYNEVQRAREMGVPVVASMGDTGASAAYYAASASDVIVVNPNTLTGSIGVIWTFTNMSAYYEEEGIEYYIARSGDFKDMGGSWRGLTDEEKEYADEVVMGVYDLFIADVAQGRNMTVSDVEELADGRVYTGAEARRLGLVDEFGNLYDAIDIAGGLGGIEGEPDVYYVNKPSLARLLFGSETSMQEVIKGLVRYYEESPVGVLRA